MDITVGTWLDGLFQNGDETEWVPFLVTKVYNPTNVAGYYFGNNANINYSGTQVVDGSTLKWPDVPGVNVSPVVPSNVSVTVDPGHVPDPHPEEGTPEHIALKRVDEQNPYTPESANA